jgi:hypothetical protein
MKISLLRGIAIAAMTGIVVSARAQDADQSQYPTILEQPVDQCLPVGSPATFTVVATNADSYQWYKNNTAIDGQTNSSLTIASLSINDVAYYSASVIKGSEAVPTRMANLNVYTISTPVNTLTATLGLKTTKLLGAQTMSLTTSADLGGGGAITVYGSPVTSGGTMGSCPGAYSGYVTYARTISQGWGWAPTAGAAIIQASDLNRADTKVQVMGKSGDTFCDQTTVNLPTPPNSVKYRFGIYFPPGTQVPTNAYPITLTGFDQ